MRLLICLTIILFAGLAGCLVSPTSNVGPAAIVSVVHPRYAKGFEIQNLSDGSARIILFNLENVAETLQVIVWKKEVVERIACLSTTHISFIDQLRCLDALKATGFANLVKNANAKERIDRGEVMNITVGYDLDDEKVFSVNPQLLFVYPYGGGNFDKYLKTGIGCVQVSEYLEAHPLGRAEWIKVFGVLLNQEERADSIFNSIEMAYNALKQRVASLNVNHPVVFTGSYDSGNWYAPPGNSFVSNIIYDAGAKYIFQDSIRNENIVIPFESLYKSAVDIDFWGKVISDEGIVTLEKLSGEDSRILQTKAFNNGDVFYCNTVTSDYHGDAIIEPQAMLADLIAIFHPEVMPEHQGKYFVSLK